MKVLSLFDGISVGQLSLQKAGINVESYRASEIEDPAIGITQHHFPDTIQLGDVRGVNVSDADLIIGGSPCQNISVSGNMQGLKGDKSSLFYEFKRVVDLNPNAYFFLENVKGQKEAIKEITSLMGVQPYLVNSALVSAQTRNRYYWTNIPFSDNIQDRNITLSDISEDPLLEEVKGTIYKNWDQDAGTVLFRGKLYAEEDFFGTMKAFSTRKKVSTVSRGGEDKARTITSGSPNIPGDGSTAVYPSNRAENAVPWRGLTVLEQERCQTLPDNYTNVADTKKGKRSFHIGNSWTVEVITEFFMGLH